MNKYLFILDYNSGNLMKITKSLGTTTRKRSKVIYKGGSVKGLVYEVFASNKDEAFILFFNRVI
jgi:hypothetical protein